MLRSLVGSEMCIRDRLYTSLHAITDLAPDLRPSLIKPLLQQGYFFSFWQCFCLDIPPLLMLHILPLAKLNETSCLLFLSYLPRSYKLPDALKSCIISNGFNGSTNTSLMVHHASYRMTATSTLQTPHCLRFFDDIYNLPCSLQESINPLMLLPVYACLLYTSPSPRDS